MTTVLPVPKAHYGRLKNYIGGRWVDSVSTDVRSVIDPGTGQVIAEVPLSTAAEVTEAVNVAQAAFEAWRRVPPVRRARLFFKLKQLMTEQIEDLARTLAQEMGKTIADARAELWRAIEEVECACGIPTLMRGYVNQDVSPGVDLQAHYTALGVFFMVPSFNFPALVPLEYFPYAVACGNTYINKPSPLAPISQVRIFELLHECGFPPGVINLVHGDAEVVNTLIDDPRTKGLSFVGSTPVGKLLYQKMSLLGKRAQCATGAKNHLVVMPDVDLDKTVASLMSSFFGAAGQRCLAGSVLVPVGDVAEPLLEKFVAAARRMRLGYGLDESAELGPVVSRSAQKRIVGLIDQGVAEGATLLLDGRHARVDGYPEGAFVGPTIFDHVTPEMSVVREEIFGPVACVRRARSLDEAIGYIQASPFGHSGLLFTRSGAAARKFAFDVPCGNIGINVPLAATQSFATLGGMKDSAYGDLHGRSESVLFFTERKIVITRWE